MTIKVNSPRQAALAVGELWYIPVKPCAYCSTRSKRSVTNGDCTGCVTKPLSNETAVYQGKPCKHGHSGLRYKSNRRCVSCR